MDRRGGSAAVYASNSIYKVDAISFLRRTSEDDGGNHNSGSSEKKEKGFASILENEVDKANVAKDVVVKTSGYTRMGVPTALVLKMRDYTYQQ